MSEWRPIETAPKDGTSILAPWLRSAIIIHWRKREKCWAAGGIRKDDIVLLYRDPPTHWMPLPLPPETA